jgi:hypothetical protein
MTVGTVSVTLGICITEAFETKFDNLTAGVR